MKTVKILYLSNSTADSELLGKLLVGKLQEVKTCNLVIDLSEVSQVSIIKALTLYDVLIFDGTIETDVDLRNSIYDCLDLSILKRDNFFVVTRNTLPMNIVPPHSNLNQFEAILSNTYQIDKNRFEHTVNDRVIPNEEVVDWIYQELNQFLASYDETQRPETALELFNNLSNDVKAAMGKYSQPKKKQIFVSFRGKYQKEKYYGYNVEDVKKWIKENHHNNGDEWDEPFTYDSGALTSEFMVEQRIWTVQSIISSKIKECDEFWIFETLQERDEDGNIVHYSYWDSWWCVAEVMEVLQQNTRGLLGKDFKLKIFNPKFEKKVEEISLERLPKLTAFESRELMRLKNEGDIELNSLHLREDKRNFRDASWIMKRIRYKILKIQWNFVSKQWGEDISIPFKQYVEDVNCRVYEDAFLTQRIYIDGASMESGRTRDDVLREGYCKYFLNLVGSYKDTPQYEGIYTTTTEELEHSIAHNKPVVVQRKDKGGITQKQLPVEKYGTMFFFWLPLICNPFCPNNVKRTGPDDSTIQEITLYKVKQ